jgi:hypothetical protein
VKKALNECACTRKVQEAKDLADAIDGLPLRTFDMAYRQYAFQKKRHRGPALGTVSGAARWLDSQNMVVADGVGTKVILVKNSNDDIDAALTIYHERVHFNGVAKESKAFTAEAILGTKCGWMKYDAIDKFFTRDGDGLVTDVDAASIEQTLSPKIDENYKKLVNTPDATDPYLDKLRQTDPAAFRIGDYFQNVSVAQ